MFKINLFLLAFFAISASAHESPSFTSIKQCVSDAYSSDGFNMSTSEAREYCQSVSFSFSSIKQCVSEAYSSDGFDMSTSEAREYCQSVNFSFSSIKQCVSDAYSSDGFDMSTSEARDYCQKAFKRTLNSCSLSEY